MSNQPARTLVAEMAARFRLGAPNHAPMVQWQDAATFNLILVLKRVDTGMNTNRIRDTIRFGAGPSDTRSGTPKPRLSGDRASF